MKKSSIKVNATASDSKASITGDGNINVTAGTNTIKIVVRAENGSEKEYTLIVNVIDQNPINVTINNNNYTVIKLRDNFECPDSFMDSTIKINDLDIPSCYNEKLNYQLVGLKLSDGTIEKYIYDNDNYTKYIETIGTSLKLIINDYDGELDGLDRYEEEIDGVKYNVFKKDNNSKYYVVYGTNVETGNKDFYTYDTISKTFSLYNKEEVKENKDLTNLYLYIIIAFGCCLFLSIICVITLLNKISRIKKLNVEMKKDILEKEEIIKQKEEEQKTSEVKEKKRKKKSKKEKEQ